MNGICGGRNVQNRSSQWSLCSNWLQAAENNSIGECVVIGVLGIVVEIDLYFSHLQTGGQVCAGIADSQSLI